MCSTLISKNNYTGNVITLKKKLIINENNYLLTDLAISMSSGDSIRSSDPVISVTIPVFSPYSPLK